MNKSKGFSSRMETVTESYVLNALMTKKKNELRTDTQNIKRFTLNSTAPVGLTPMLEVRKHNIPTSINGPDHGKDLANTSAVIEPTTASARVSKLTTSDFRIQQLLQCTLWHTVMSEWTNP